MIFIKKYLIYIIAFALFVAFIMLSAISRIFFIIALCILLAISIYGVIKSYAKYKVVSDYHESDDLFDATSIDYDEDVYYFASDDRNKKEIKSKIGKMNAMMPTLIFGFMAIGSLIMIFYSFFHI